jgi:hypothetical protein
MIILRDFDTSWYYIYNMFYITMYLLFVQWRTGMFCLPTKGNHGVPYRWGVIRNVAICRAFTNNAVWPAEPYDTTRTRHQPPYLAGRRPALPPSRKVTTYGDFARAGRSMTKKRMEDSP